ncbi:trmt11 [Symbiodinium natans]|uniref:Trmt11 protein n=1 Tax=Symbiodinium natans TaxID=878477 RepID=A0A812RXH3_9DINO|nr:trmt11 [Symbiodinium natans]
MASKDGGREFLVLFAHHNMYFNMRFQELQALAALLGVSAQELYAEAKPTALSASMAVLVRLPGGEADAKKICERSVLVKAILEVWAQGSQWTEVVEACLAQTELRRQRRQYLAPPRSICLRVESFGKTMTMEEKTAVMETLRPLFDGDEVVDLRDPDTTLWVLEEHSHRSDEKTHLGKRTRPPQRVVLGRQVAGGRSTDKKLKSGEKCFFHRYDLSKRAVLGPTTLDNELSFIMANCAGVRSRQLGMDPFCGTGGLLIAMAHFGAKLFAGEIDIRVVRGWRIAYTKNKAAMLDAARSRGLAKGPIPAADATQAANECSGSCDSASSWSLQYLRGLGLPLAVADGAGASKAPKQPNNHNAKAEKDPALTSAGGCNIFTNFVQYGFPSPEVVVCDNAMPPWRGVARGWLDFIITDPPYGVRAGAKKSGRDETKKQVVIQDVSNYIPSKVSYGEEELSEDLLTFAAASLVDGGKLVFLVPVDLADFLGIDRAAVEQDNEGARPNFHDICHPKAGRKKDPRLCVSETTRDPLLLDESRYVDFIPQHGSLQLLGASLQVLSGGLGRLLVTMQRRPR